jgi:hypothetical protein
MAYQTASVAQFPAYARLQALPGTLDSRFHGVSGDVPGNKRSLDGICLWWILDRQAERAASRSRLPGSFITSSRRSIT